MIERVSELPGAGNKSYWRWPGAKKVWGLERKVTCASRLAAHEDCFPGRGCLESSNLDSEARGDVNRAAVAGHPLGKNSPTSKLEHPLENY